MAISIDKQVVATADDAYQATEIPWFSNSTEYLYLSDVGHDVRVYVRFAGCTIPQGASIVRAYLTPTCWATCGAGNVFTINGFLEDDVGDFPDRATADGYNLTVKSVVWTPDAWTVGSEYNSPSLVDIVQEIVDQPGWAGDHIGFRTDTLTREVERYIRSYEYNGNDQGMKLHIEYSLPVAGDMQRSAIITLELI